MTLLFAIHTPLSPLENHIDQYRYTSVRSRDMPLAPARQPLPVFHVKQRRFVLTWGSAGPSRTCPQTSARRREVLSRSLFRSLSPGRRPLRGGWEGLSGLVQPPRKPRATPQPPPNMPRYPMLSDVMNPHIHRAQSQ